MSEREKIKELATRILWDAYAFEHEDIEAILSALESAGYVIVKREPTRDMTMAGAELLPAVDGVFGHAGSLCAKVYRAMIAAQENKP